jgi:hypothetical protein
VEAIAPADSRAQFGSGEPKVQVRSVGIAGLTEAGDRQTCNGVEGEPQQGCVCEVKLLSLSVVVEYLSMSTEAGERVSGMASNTNESSATSGGRPK